ncbi:hypothetical protein [Pleurocapsa sp. FMAR1]|uniref:hypothetical protein n=1 Tax=Pleurocapsa sp. FMAR1 TaxID=3040204 RepID=UPI0029C87CDB|nr:hypothetical protein [Pleurocapsa sp. FMAR1]
MEFLNPSIEQLVTEIIAVNRAWKEAKDLFDHADNSLANSLRDLKARLQVRLLHSYAPSRVYLTVDTNLNSDYDEPLYGLQLMKSIHGRKDAAHMPVRVAEKNLSAQELQQFVKG